MNAVRPMVIETQVYAAPFGLGLWDPVLGRLVDDGMTVDVARFVQGRGMETISAMANRAGVFAARGLPALRAFEAGAPQVPVPHLVTVRDQQGRYLPFALRVALPDADGLLRPACADLWASEASASPPRGKWVALLPAPAYPVSAGLAAVRAVCIDDANGAPAAHVVIELRHDGRLLAWAVSDGRGQALAVFPYPEPAASPIFSPGSPPGPPAPAQALTQASWHLEVAVRWRRDLPLYAGDPALDALPDLCELLTQPPAAALVDAASPSLPLHDATLQHGTELVLPWPSARLRIRTA